MASLPEVDLPPVGLLYDERMCCHATPDGSPHPECPDRVRSIWKLLESSGIPQRCQVLKPKPAEEKHIGLVHTREHIELVKEIGSDGYDAKRRSRVAARFNSIYLNDGSSDSAFLAAGGVLEVTRRVAEGQLRSGLAIVRPPGHHAENGEMMGFCIFNNIAVAASYLLNERPELGIKKILVVDWDVHHGNGTQKMFYNDPRLLYFSVHRFDNGGFYPAGGDGSHVMIGENSGTGYNVNVPWEHGKCGDADYFAVWDHVLIPVAEAYKPDIILISAGFDAAIGDPLGGCLISPYGYSVLLYKLMGLAHGKIVLALEGGYNINSTARSVLACAEVLFGKKPLLHALEDGPFESTFRVIKEVCSELCPYWPTLAVELLPDALIGAKRAYPMAISSSSDSDEEERTSSNAAQPEMNVVDIEVPLSTLSLEEVRHEKEITSNHLSIAESYTLSSSGLPLPDSIVSCSISWRSVLSKIYIWYGSYGSNMWMPRFLCYIRGGQVEGMKKPCSGSNDKTVPKDVVWRTVLHRLFFASSYTPAWGAGGVAFLHPETTTSDKAYMCLYKITLEQFNDVLRQENCLEQEMASPLLDPLALNVIVEKKTFAVNSLMESWYSNVLYLGEEDGIPILSMTCTTTQLEGYLSGELPMCPPAKEYMNTLVKGLVEGKQLTEKEAMDYLNKSRL